MGEEVELQEKLNWRLRKAEKERALFVREKGKWKFMKGDFYNECEREETQTSYS